MEAQLSNLTHKVTYYYRAFGVDDEGVEAEGDMLYVTMADEFSYDMYANDYVFYDSYKTNLRKYCVDGDYNYAFFINPLKEGSIHVDPVWVENNIEKAPLFSENRIFY